MFESPLARRGNESEKNERVVSSQFHISEYVAKYLVIQYGTPTKEFVNLVLPAPSI